jgi:CRISPR-associated protein Cas2
MFILVCYDVSTETKEGRRRLRRVAKTCKSYGQRAQKSVFECKMNEKDFITMEKLLLDIIDKKEDNLRLYIMDEISLKKIRNYGKNEVIDYEEPMII